MVLFAPSVKSGYDVFAVEIPDFKIKYVSLYEPFRIWDKAVVELALHFPIPFFPFFFFFLFLFLFLLFPE